MMRTWVILAVCVVLAGCSGRDSGKQASAPAPPAPTTPATTEVAPSPSEEATSHKAGTLEPYAVSEDLREVANLAEYTKVFALDADQRAMLAKSLFACSGTQYDQLFWIYENNEYHNLPSFVTTDVVLHLYHCFFDYALRTIEAERLLPVLVRLTNGALKQSLSTLQQASAPTSKDAANRNVAFFGVAARLLGQSPVLPPAADALAKREAEAIKAHTGYLVGTIFPYKVDYSQFVPRGHYTKSEKLRRFFMAMMWYGVGPFATRFGDRTPAPGPVRQGVLLSYDLKRAGLLKDWETIYEPTTFFVGKADDHTPSQWLSAAEPVFGPDAGPNGVADAAKLDAVVAAIEKLPTARVRADLTLEKQVPHPAFQLRFMGQRYIPDSEIMQRLAAPVVRPFPSGLDVMAVLGSPRARAILDADPATYNPRNWADYTPERAKLEGEFAAVPDAQWTSNLYWGWLNGLRPLLDRIPEGFPSFMRSDTWRDKSLHTALASWAELRHDTILYGKQPAVECGDGEERPTPTGYVEPNVPLYDRMLRLVQTTREGLSKRGLLPVGLKDSFEEFEGLVQFLKTCSEKELRGELLSEEEYREIRYIGGKIEYMTRSTIEGRPTTWDLVDKGDQQMAVIADVHTAIPNVLEVGVGRAAEILAIVPIGKKLVLTRGAILTYYEFTHPQNDRLTDEKWRAMLKAGKAPAPPKWTGSFLLAPRPASKDQHKLQSYTSGC